jgi:hypothetical protein
MVLHVSLTVTRNDPYLAKLPAVDQILALTVTVRTVRDSTNDRTGGRQSFDHDAAALEVRMMPVAKLSATSELVVQDMP